MRSKLIESFLIFWCEPVHVVLRTVEEGALQPKKTQAHGYPPVREVKQCNSQRHKLEDRMCKEEHDWCSSLGRASVKHLADSEFASPFVHFDCPPLLLEENKCRKLIMLAYVVVA